MTINDPQSCLIPEAQNCVISNMKKSRVKVMGVIKVVL